MCSTQINLEFIQQLLEVMLESILYCISPADEAFSDVPDGHTQTGVGDIATGRSVRAALG